MHFTISLSGSYQKGVTRGHAFGELMYVMVNVKMIGKNVC
jgi:hypothetical protein